VKSKLLSAVIRFFNVVAAVTIYQTLCVQSFASTIYRVDLSLAAPPTAAAYPLTGSIIGTITTNGASVVTPNDIITFYLVMTVGSYSETLDFADADNFNGSVNLLSSNNVLTNNQTNYTSLAISSIYTGSYVSFDRGWIDAAAPELPGPANFISDTSYTGDYVIGTAGTPEPASWAMMLIGSVGLAIVGYWRKTKTGGFGRARLPAPVRRLTCGFRLYPPSPSCARERALKLGDQLGFFKLGNRAKHGTDHLRGRRIVNEAVEPVGGDQHCAIIADSANANGVAVAFA
jgi:hypothetical protein